MKPVYAIIGDDDASKESHVKALKDAFIKNIGSNNVEIYDAAITQPAYMLMNLTTMSLFGGGRLVIIRNFDAWGEGAKKAPTPTDEEIIELTQYMQTPQTDTVLLLIGLRFPKKLVIWKDLYRAVEANGKILEYNLPKDWEMKGWVQKTAEEIGVKFNDANAELLLELVGKDSLALRQEIIKLKTYKQDEAITKDDIELLVYKRPRAAEFKMLEALSNKDYVTAFGILNESIDARVPIHRMVYPLMKEIRMMILVKRAVADQANDTEIERRLMAEDFFKMKPTPWVIKQLKKRAYNYNVEQMIKSIWTVGVLDYELKGGLRIKRPFQLSYELTFYNLINNSKENDLYL